MKKSRNGLFFGIILVCAAVALILDGLGISISGAQISAWSIVGGVLCLAWLVVEIVELKFSHIFFPLAFIFLLFEGQIATWLGHDDPNLISNWLVLLAALLLTIGVGVLGGNLKKRKKTQIDKDGNTVVINTNEKKNFSQASVVFVDAADLGEYEVENNCGSIHVYIENADRYGGSGALNVDNNCGSMVVHVPKAWRVVSNVDNNLGSVKIPSHETQADAPVLKIMGENNLGSLAIIFE